MNRLLNWTLYLGIVGTLAACASAPVPAPVYPAASSGRAVPSYEPAAQATPAALPQQSKSRWTPVGWGELPGLSEDSMGEAWSAWLRSCERPGPALAPLCVEVRRLSPATEEDKRSWMMARLQPYRVDPLYSNEPGLLTGYYEPVVEAARVPGGAFQVPLYQPPANLGKRKPWFSRQEIDTLPEAQAALRGREIVYLSDAVAALNLQIQGSGRIRVTEPDGRQHMVRLAYAGSNDQPYRSVGRWLAEQGAVRDASWPSIRTWVAQNPGRMQQMLWSNPRVVFFREEPLPDTEAGPRGAQGVPLTPGRSIAVDPGSIPYGTPVWLASNGSQARLQKLVLAQCRRLLAQGRQVK